MFKYKAREKIEREDAPPGRKEIGFQIQSGISYVAGAHWVNEM
jgi:hypothetical protein